MVGIEYFYRAWEKLGTTRSDTRVEFTLPTCPPYLPPPPSFQISPVLIENNAYAFFGGNKVHLKHIIYDYRYNPWIRGSSCLRNFLL